MTWHWLSTGILSAVYFWVDQGCHLPKSGCKSCWCGMANHFGIEYMNFIVFGRTQG